MRLGEHSCTWSTSNTKYLKTECIFKNPTSCLGIELSVRGPGFDPEYLLRKKGRKPSKTKTKTKTD
jgi:hypothetical protein